MALRNPMKLLQTFQALRSMALFAEGLKEQKSGGGPEKLTQEYRLAKQEIKVKRDAYTVARRTYNDKQHVAASQYYARQREASRGFGSSGRKISKAGPKQRGGPTIREKLNYLEAADDIRSRFPREVLKEKSKQRQIDRDDWDRRRIYKLERGLEEDYRNSLSQPPESIPRVSGPTAYDLIGDYNESVINPAGRVDRLELLPEIYE